MLHRLIAKYDMYSDLFILKEQIYHDQVHKTKFMISAFESAQLSVINYILIAAPWSPLPASKPFITPERYFVARRNTSPSTHFSSSFYLSNVQDWLVLRLPCKQSQTVFAPFVSGFFYYVDTMFLRFATQWCALIKSLFPPEEHFCVCI